MQGNPFSVYGALALTNLEALANGEGGATGTTTGEYVYYDFNGQRWYGVENEGTGQTILRFQRQRTELTSYLVGRFASKLSIPHFRTSKLRR